MKIAWVSAWPPRWCSVAAHSEELVTALRKKAQVEVVSHTDAGRGKEKGLWPAIDLENADWQRKLDSTIEKINPDVIGIQLDFASFGYQPKATHFSTNPADSFLLLESLFRWKTKGIPVVITYHNIKDNISYSQALYYLISFNSSEIAIVFEEYQKYILEDLLNVPGKRTFIIPATTVLPLKSSKNHLKAKFGLDQTKQTIGLIGWFEPYKNFESVIAIWPKIINKFPNAEILIAGSERIGDSDSGKYAQKILDLARKNQESNIKIFNKTFDSQEFEEIISALDLLVLPYQECTQSLLLSKAYARGIPVLASSTGGLKDSIRHSKAGILFQNKNNLEKNILKILTDNIMQKKLSLQGIKYYQKNNLEIAVKKYLNAFDFAKKIIQKDKARKRFIA